jgi:hypothetical protein
MRQFDLFEWSILIIHGYPLHRVQSRISAIDNFAEYGVFGVEMGLFRIGDKELGFIRIWPGVGHG